MTLSRCWVLLFSVLWSVGVIATSVRGEDLYHGRVVDEETGQPLVGAAVTVIWFRSPILGLESTRDFQSAQETVTDNEGKFSLVVSPGIDWNPFTYIRKQPQIVIYQPGYEPTWAGWRIRNKFSSETDLAEALKKGITIKLPKLRTKEALIKFTNLNSLTHPTVRYENIPTLIQAVNAQNKIVGLKPYPAQGGKDP